MADKLDLPHPVKLVPAKQNGFKLLTPNNFSYNVSGKDKFRNKIFFCCSEKKTLKCPVVATVCTKTNNIIKTSIFGIKSVYYLYSTKNLPTKIDLLKKYAIIIKYIFWYF